MPEPELLALYRDALCVLVPSRDEGFSLPIVEAMASGVPVLASRIPAHEELLRDPAAELSVVTCPVLVVQGTADLQVRVADARMLAAARPGARLLVLPGMNHVFKVPAEGRAANMHSYADPSLPLAPGLVEGIADFVLD